MRKKSKNFRLSYETIRELSEISQILGVSETEVISRAIHNFYIQLKGEEQISVGAAVVSFSEYHKVQEQLTQVMYKLGELQGQLQAKEELIAELKTKLNRRWWDFMLI